MITLLGLAVLTCAASVVVGRAALGLAGGRDNRPAAWLAPALGLSALLAAAVVGSRIADGAGAAAALATLTAAAAIFVAIGTGRLPGPRPRRAAASTLLAVLALVAAALPFFLAGHAGILGVGLINDDMASHLQIAEHVRAPLPEPPRFVEGGYPIGPHALVAGLAELTGATLVDSFSALTIALAPLLALTIVGALGHLSPRRRLLAGLVAALSYLSAAYIGQGAFKEPLEALIVIAFGLYVAELIGLGDSETAAIAGARPAIWRALPVGLLAAASVLNYSLPGLLWVAAVGVAIAGLRYWVIGPRPQSVGIAWRRLAPYGVVALAVITVATATEWSRIADFTSLDSFRPDRAGSDLGNLRQSISPAEALGIWPTGDFRTAAADAGPPALLFWAGAAFALLAAAAGTLAAWRQRRIALLGALGATVAIWIVAALVATPYFAAKALAIAAPVVMALALGWALQPGSRLRALAAAALVLGAAGSSFLALRTSPVGPPAHAAELDRIRPHVEGARVLFLGRDDFIGWELRGAEVEGVVKNHFNVGRVPSRYRNPNGTGDKFDIDALTAKGLRRYEYVLAPNGRPRSQYPQGLVPVEATPTYTLLEVQSVGKRRTLEEGPDPGQRLRCRGNRPTGPLTGAGPGTVVVAFGQAPSQLDERAWDPAPSATHEQPATVSVKLDPGVYDVGIAYDSRRPLTLSGPGYEEELAANLDFRGPTPYLAAGSIAVPEPGEVTIEARVGEPSALARLLGAPNEAHLRRIAFTSVVPRQPLAPAEACGRYVDYYVP